MGCGPGPCLASRGPYLGVSSPKCGGSGISSASLNRQQVFGLVEIFSILRDRFQKPLMRTCPRDGPNRGFPAPIAHSIPSPYTPPPIRSPLSFSHRVLFHIAINKMKTLIMDRIQHFSDSFLPGTILVDPSPIKRGRAIVHRPHIPRCPPNILPPRKNSCEVVLRRCIPDPRSSLG